MKEPFRWGDPNVPDTRNRPIFTTDDYNQAAFAQPQPLEAHPPGNRKDRRNVRSGRPGRTSANSRKLTASRRGQGSRVTNERSREDYRRQREISGGSIEG